MSPASTRTSSRHRTSTSSGAGTRSRTLRRGSGTRPSSGLRPSAGVLALRSLMARPLASYYLLLSSTLLLAALGLVMVLSASSVKAYEVSRSSYHFAGKQAMFMAVGLTLLWWGSRLSVRFWRATAWPLLMASFLLLVLVLVPGVGMSVNGNQNWIEVGGGFNVQPSEGAKLALVIWSADLLARKAPLLTQWKHLLVPLLPVGLGMVALVLLGRDLGTSLLLFGILVALLFHTGAPLRLFLLLGGFGAGLVAVMTATSSARRARLLSFLHPEADPQGRGWQATRGLVALGTGAWQGMGLGASPEKWGNLPEAHTDFIFAIIGQELGMFGTFVVLALLLGIGVAGVRIAARASDPFVQVAAGGVTAWIMIQAIVNLGGVLVLLPITGVALPLVSYGGSALLSTMAAIGMLLSFARREPQAAEALRARGPGRLRQALTRPGRRGP